MNYKSSLNSAFKSSIIIIKLVIPIYIIADILYYYNILENIAFLFEPITSILNLPINAALSIVSGIFLNLYAAIAFAAPLDMSAQQWSVLAIFLGVCHSLIVENAIMKKMGVNIYYSYILRIFGGLIVAYFSSKLPSSWFNSNIANHSFKQKEYNTFLDLIYSSFTGALLLTIKIVALITLLIFIMDYIKSLKILKKSAKNISSAFSVFVGIVLGITYGAGILLKEKNSNNLTKEDIFFITTFLMICHAIIEDTLLFVIFGADFIIVVTVRIIFALIISYILLAFYKRTVVHKK